MDCDIRPRLAIIPCVVRQRPEEGTGASRKSSGSVREYNSDPVNDS